MKLILNEEQFAKDILKNRNLESDTVVKIVILIKYYKSIGMNKEQIRDEIDTIMKESYKMFNPVLWDELITTLVKKYSTDKYSLRHIESIDISERELNYISSYNDFKLERIMFIMLVYAKIGNCCGWINTELKNVYKDSKTRDNIKNQYKYIYDMVKLGLVETQKRVDGTNLRITYMDNECSSIGIKITDFTDPIMYYLKYKGKRIINCSMCNCMVEAKNNKTKYCNKCAKEVKLKQNKESKDKKQK